MSALTFENENIKLNVERQPECKVVFSITTLPLATKAAEKAAVRTISKEVNIPGFRKGRAPEALIQTQFAGQIKKEFLNILTRNSIHEAIQLSGIHPFRNNSSLKLLKCDPIDASSYNVSIEFESYPDIPPVNPSQLTISHQDPAIVTEEQIDAHIHELQLTHAEWEEITSRAAEAGDFVTVDIDHVENEQSKAVHRKSRFLLQEGRLPKWLYHLLLGLNKGDAKTGNSEPEEPTENFKSKTFHITLTKIERPILPPIDAALAKKAGVENVDLLKEAVRKSLEKEARNQAKQKMRLDIKKALLESSWFEIPGEKVKQAHQECHDIAEAEKGTLSKEERDAYAHQLFEKALESMRFSFLLSKIFQENHLRFPTNEEIRHRATEEMVMRYMRGDTTISENDTEYYIQTAENEMAAETALDFLIEHCKKS